jgi:hypothetical protein
MNHPFFIIFQLKIIFIVLLFILWLNWLSLKHIMQHYKQSSFKSYDISDDFLSQWKFLVINYGNISSILMCFQGESLVACGGTEVYAARRLPCACASDNFNFEPLPSVGFCVLLFHCNRQQFFYLIYLVRYLKTLSQLHTVPCWVTGGRQLYLLSYWIHHSVGYTVLFSTALVVITILLYTQFWPPDVMSWGGLLMSSPSEGWQLTGWLLIVTPWLFATDPSYMYYFFIFFIYLVGWDLTPIRSLWRSPRFV